MRYLYPVTKRLIGVLVFTLPITAPTFCQPAAMEDSLLALLKTNVRTDTNRVNVLNRLALLKLNSDQQASQQFARQALVSAHTLRYPKGQGQALRVLALHQALAGQTDSALYYARQARTIFTAQHNVLSLADVSMDMGNIYARENKPLSLQHYRQASQTFDSLLKLSPNDKKLLDKRASASHNIADIYKNQGRFSDALAEELNALRGIRKACNREKEGIFLGQVASLMNETSSCAQAITYARQGLNILAPLNNHFWLSFLHQQLGKAFTAQRQYDSSAIALRQAIKHAQLAGYTPYVAAAQTDYAEVLAKKGQLNRALAIWDSAIALHQQIRDDRAIAVLQNMAASELLRAKRMREAVRRLEKALQLGRKVASTPEISETQRLLAQSYAQLGAYPRAYAALQEHLALRDSLMSAEKNQQLAELRTRYETEQKDQRIGALQREATLERQSRNRAFALGGAFLGFGLMFAYLWNKQTKTNRRLNQVLDEKALLLKEIHHRVKNNLQLIYALLNMQGRRATEPPVQAAIQQGQSRIKSMAIVHERLYQTDGPGEVAFSEYANQLVMHLADSYLIDPGQVDIRIEASPVRFPLDVAVPVGLILTELITNSFKYAFTDGRSGRLDIQVNTEANDYLRVVVQDDGPGLPPNFDASSVNTLGLDIVRTLTEQLQGDLQIMNRLPHGARFAVRFPIA